MSTAACRSEEKTDRFEEKTNNIPLAFFFNEITTPAMLRVDCRRQGWKPEDCLRGSGGEQREYGSPGVKTKNAMLSNQNHKERHLTSVGPQPWITNRIVFY